MRNQKIVFSFDLSVVEALRGAVNEKTKVSFDKEHAHERNKTLYLAWLRICACMDRIEDTLQHINSMQLSRNEKERSAFGFLDFINHSCVVIDCIKTLGKIFGVDENEFKIIEGTQDIFGNALNVNGTDGQFFEYIRSLCVIHPVDTTRTKHPYMQGAAIHCCPFVVWNNGLDSSSDLCAYVYTTMSHTKDKLDTAESSSEMNTLLIPLYIERFEKYLTKWIDFLSVVIRAIEEHGDKVYEEYKEELVKRRDEFETEVEYIEYLKQENQKRFGTQDSFLFDEHARSLSCNVSNEQNKSKVEKYQNAIRYAIDFVHASLQDMSFEGFEHTGILGENDTGTNLFLELYFPTVRGEEFNQYHYNFSKVYQLIDGGYYERRWARVLLEKVKPLINRYVYFSNQETDSETVLLVNVALYLNALEQDSALNRSIPNDFRFREHLLTEG